MRPLVLAVALALAAAPAAGQAALTGVNLASAEFSSSQLPGTYGVDYTYPTTAEVDHFVGIGMNVFRVPFRWERLQPTLNSPLNAAELARLDAFVTYATAAGATVVLDPHNYARYRGAVIGSAALPVAAFRDFWGRVATHYAGNARVAFGLMNEPHTMATELWLADANEAIDAIRDAGAPNLILVPGNGYTGAHSWLSSSYGTPNGSVMQNVVDPLNNYAYDLHQYLDGDSSGTSATCTSATVGSQRLAAVTAWLRANGRRGFLGEFGGAANTTCLAALGDLLSYVDANTDVWLGWTYWAAGPWWPASYMFSIEPDAQGNDRPQTAVLALHFAKAVATESAPTAAGVALRLSPNPSRGRTVVAFDLAAAGDVEAAVFDVLGRQVATLVQGTLAAGQHEVVVDTPALVPGVYVVRVLVGAEVSALRLVVSR